MTESELVEALTSYHDLFISMLSVYLTVTSGYLVVAYLIGGKLTGYQVGVISVLFVFFGVVTTWAGTGFAMRGIAYIEPLRQLKPDQTYYGHPAAVAIIFVALLGGIIASLGFMWAVRHPKKK